MYNYKQNAAKSQLQAKKYTETSHKGGPAVPAARAFGAGATRPSPTSRGLGCFVSFRMGRPCVQTATSPRAGTCRLRRFLGERKAVSSPTTAGVRPLLVGRAPSARTTAPQETHRSRPAPCSWGGSASNPSRRLWPPALPATGCRPRRPALRSGEVCGMLGV